MDRMHIVGINKDNNKIFESQSYSNELEKSVVSYLIDSDAINAGIEIDIVTMTNEELINFTNR